MSEPKLISPMLDGFMIGSSMCSRQGIMCCPAMPKNSDKKYIVKIISIPASQVQLDALLLTGAYHSQEQALAYFKTLAENTIEEVGVLKKLSALEGFLAYESYQLVQKEDEPGYQVYLLGNYRPSLQQQLQKHNMTHLNAVNLGLDMCAALAVCRRAGYLYADLKPQNIFISDDGEYRIGDLGFLRLDGLKYAALDERFYSAYTAPEVLDIFATVNTTIDTYAAGMILYQTYNDGKLPIMNGEPLPPPQYADYEMAEIIMKAIDPDPEKRWADPIAMGQAIVAYMQKNGANNVPIVPIVQESPVILPVAVAEPEADQAPAAAAEEEIAEPQQEDRSDMQEVETSPEETDASLPVAPEAPEVVIPADDEMQQQMADMDASDESSDIPMTLADLDAFLEQMESDTDWMEEISELPADPVLPADTENEAAAPREDEFPCEAAAEEEPAPETAPAEEPALATAPEEELPGEQTPQEEIPAAINSEADADDPASLAFMADLVADETAPSEDFAQEVDYDDLSSETFSILALADELLQHETPGGVVAPDPIEVPMPEPIVLDSEPAEVEAEADVPVVDADFQPPPIVPSSEYYEAEAEYDEEEDEYYDDEEDLETSSGSSKKWIIGILIALLIAGLAFGGYLFYTDYYLQKIDALEISSSDSSLVVKIDSDIDDELLQVVCVDTHGTKLPASVKDGIAVFDGLHTDTTYTIQVEIEGFHKLIGQTSTSHHTPKTTKIYSFLASPGTLEGQVELNFQADGPTPANWKVVYSTDGEPERSQTFIKNLVTVSGLTIGKTYTFTLTTDVQSIYLSGETSLSYEVKPLIMAQNVQITGCSNGKLSVQWDVPTDHAAEGWIVTCYNSNGFRQEITTESNVCEFSIQDATQEYHVEVKAKGMNSGVTASIKANSVTIKDYVVDTSDPQTIKLSWGYTDAAPEGNVIVMYNIGDSGIQDMDDKAALSTEFSPLIPNATYSFTLQLKSSVTLFNNQYQYTTPAAPEFSGFKISKSDLYFTMCETPAKEDWSKEDSWVHKDIKNFTSTFKLGQKASFKVALYVTYDDRANDEITTMYVIRDKQGNVISYDNSTVKDWNDMWYTGMCSLDVPKLPEAAGDYTIEVYFNGCLAHQQEFKMVNP